MEEKFFEGNEDEFVEDDIEDLVEYENIKSLTKKDLVDLTINNKDEARFIIDSYYQLQDMRIVKANQIRSIIQGYDNNSKDKEYAKEHLKALFTVYESFSMQEKNMQKILDKYSDENYLSKWAKSNIGIGPVLASAIQAYFELKEDENGNCISHVGSWWSYAGLNDNNRPWLGKEKSTKIVNEAIEKYGSLTDEAMVEIAAVSQWPLSHFADCKTKSGAWDKTAIIKKCSLIPYNKDLKVVCWKIGQSFHKQKNKENSLYGRLFNKRLEYETRRNLNGDYADQAAAILKSRNNLSAESKKTLSAGQLTISHLYRRAERYVTKLFISHAYEAAYYNKYGVPAPNPYILDFGDHIDYIGPEVPYDSITV